MYVKEAPSRMHGKILRLAIPNIISNVTIPLLGAVDLAMMGHLDSLIFAGAVSVGAMIFNFMYWAMGFLRMGTAGFTAQAFGAEEKEETGRILGRGLALALLGSLLLWLLQDVVLWGVYTYLKPEDSLWEITRSYFQIRIWGAPAALSSFAFSGWFIGMQNTKIPMWIAIAINIFNVVFNYIFVFVLGMQADGVALGTVAAQYMGLLLNVICVLQLYPQCRKYIIDKGVLQKAAVWRFLDVNKDVFFRTLLIICVFSFFTAESTRYGNTILVMNTILYQFFIFYSYAVDGFGHAAEALIGKFTGAALWVERRISIRYIFIWGLLMAVLFLGVYAGAYTPILKLFTKDVDVLQNASAYFYWVLAITLVGFPAFLWDGVFAGALKTKPMLYTMLVAVVVYFMVYYCFQMQWGNHALWAALLAYLTIRTLMMTALARRFFVKF